MNKVKHKNIDVIAMGRATIDLYAREIGAMENAKTFSKYLGGSPANTAVAMANLGLNVGYIGKVSDDQFGRYIIEHLSKKKVDVSNIAIDKTKKRSGVTIGEILKDGKCNYFMYRKDCADLYIECSDINENYIKKAKMLLISGTSLTQSPARESVLLAIEYARNNGVKVVLDLDFRNDTWDSMDKASVYYMTAALKSSIVIATREEFDVMERLYLKNKSGNDDLSAKYLLDRGVEMVSIKRGREGSKIYTKDNVYQGGIYSVKALKTFGAGDAYSGAFNYGLIKGLTIEESLQYAAAGAAITISGHSCADSTPTLKELKNFMSKNAYQKHKAK